MLVSGGLLAHFRAMNKADGRAMGHGAREANDPLPWGATDQTSMAHEKLPSLKAVVVEDQELPRNALLKLLELTQPGIQVVGIAADVPTAKVEIRKSRPDVVFLDVELGGQTGFDLLTALGDQPPMVIFTTAKEGYALAAIRFSAMDYLLKPVDVDELDRAVKRAASAVDAERRKGQMESLVQNLAQNGGANRRITLPMLNGHERVLMSDILYCNSDGNYTDVFLRDGTKRTVSRPILHFEELLAGAFVRVHNEHLVNLDHVTEYIKGEGGTVQMSDGKSIAVSRRKKQELMDALGLN